MMLKDGAFHEEYVIEKINLAPKLSRRLGVLGIREGAKITILSKINNGPMIIRLETSRFALGKRFGEGIMIGVQS